LSKKREPINPDLSKAFPSNNPKDRRNSSLYKPKMKTKIEPAVVKTNRAMTTTRNNLNST
jgi:hypothetical protein